MRAPCALPRRSAASALLASAVQSVTPDPKAAARKAQALAIDSVPEPIAPRMRPDRRRAGRRDGAQRRRRRPGVHPPRVRAPVTSVVVTRSTGRVAGVTTSGSAAAAATVVDPGLLARRATWGARPSVVTEIRTAGVDAWLTSQLAPSTIDDSKLDALVAAQWPRLSLATWEVRDTYYPSSTGDLGYDITQAYLARAIWSKRQLFEVMVDFWTNHLVVTAPWGEAWDSAHRFHIDVVRKHALGRYADMLVAAAKHPAMLLQLDNASSTKRAPNENFGREVLELHTVGVAGGYLESDIRRSAQALTGMSVDQESGEYQYRHIRHHRGSLSILGWTNANASAFGEAVGVQYLTHLARHAKTARRIATKLATRFVADTPPTALVDRLAQVYLDNDTRIAPVLKALLTSPEFAASAGQKTKRPLEDIVSTVRVLGVTPGKDTKGWLNDVLWNAKVAGQAPMGWPAPNGYPDVAAAWSSTGTTLARWNFHMGQGWTASDPASAKVTYPALRALLPATLPTTYGAFVDALSTRLLLAKLPSAKRDAVCAFLDKTAASPLGSTDAAVGWRLPYVVALVLDTPEFATR